MSKMRSKTPGSLSVWILATRPKTLPAAVAPVIVGSAVAFTDQCLAPLPAMAALAVALLMQVGVNLANDYFDYLKGVDTPDRLGPMRVTQSGLIPLSRMKAAMGLIFVLALLPGLYLAKIGGWPVVVIGILSILAALAYSGGPYPLASHGLGDFFVFIFFGLIAVCGTYYVQALRLGPMAFLMGIAVGFLITAILVVNNLRDLETDRQAGKHTLAVLIGIRATKLEYSLLHTAAYILPAAVWLCELAEYFILLPILSLPLAVPLNRTIWKNPGGTILNQALAGTARLALIFSLLLSIGLILPTALE